MSSLTTTQNEVESSLTFNEKGYVPNPESVKFIMFIQLAGVEENASAEIHYKLADKFFGGDEQVIIEVFRGAAKSTMVIWLFIYIASLGYLPGFGKVNFIGFIGDSMKNGVKNTFRNIVNKIDRSEFLQKLITVKRGTEDEVELVNADGAQLNLKGYGANTNFRGVNYNGARPDIVVLDDITTNEAESSEIIQNTINDNFYKSIIPALNPQRFRVFLIGTPISERDLLHQLSDNPEWVLHKFPVAKEFPCSEEEFQGAWEDRFSYKAVKSKYETYKASGKLQAFSQEYMLEITDLSTLLVDPEDIQWFDHSTLVQSKQNYSFYISTDFATSTKKSADYSTIGVWAVSSNSDWLLVDGQCKRQTMQDNIEDLFDYVKRWKPISVGIESSGQQGGFLSIIQDMQMKRNTWFSFAQKKGSKEPGIRPVSDKVKRFVTGVQPKFKQKKILFPRKETVAPEYYSLNGLVEEMEKELSLFTLAGGVKALKHDDAIDLLNQLSEMDIYTPTEPSEKSTTIIDKDGFLWTFENDDDDDFSGINNTTF